MTSFKPQPIYPRYPLDRRLGGPQSRSGRGGEGKNSQPPPETELSEPEMCQLSFGRSRRTKFTEAAIDGKF